MFSTFNTWLQSPLNSIRWVSAKNWLLWLFPAEEGERIIYSSNDSYFANREAAICVCGPTNMCSSSKIYMCGLKSIIWEGRRYCWSMMSIWMHGAFVECSGWRRNNFCWTLAGSSEAGYSWGALRWSPSEMNSTCTNSAFWTSCIRPLLAKSRFYPDLFFRIWRCSKRPPGWHFKHGLECNHWQRWQSKARKTCCNLLTSSANIWYSANIHWSAIPNILPAAQISTDDLANIQSVSQISTDQPH